MDEGRSYRYLGLDCVDGRSFDFGLSEDSVRHTVGIPYLESDLVELLSACSSWRALPSLPH